QPRVADGAQRPLRLRARRPRLHEAHDDRRLRRGGPRRAGAGGHPAGRGRRPRRARAVAGDPARALMTAATQRIAEITLDERTVIRRNPEIERERATAIADLVRANQFSPASGLAGPFRVHLATADGRLSMELVARGNGA